MANVCVIGAGYVGLVSGACLAELGHSVTCLEIDSKRLSSLQSAEVPFHEPGLSELVERHSRAERLRFTSEYSQAIPQAEYAFIAVNTPQGAEGRADTGFVFAAVRSVLEHATDMLVLVTKSTVPVGTGDEIAHLAEEQGRFPIAVVSNPEFLREGTAVHDFLHPDRVVVGASDTWAGAAVAELYAGLDAPVVTTTRRAAELAKYTANAFLAARISFMNEISSVCDAVGVDVEDVARIVGSDPRIGPAFLRAGLGWGGSCFPKDVQALAVTAATHGCRTPILEGVFRQNVRQRERAAEMLLASVGHLPDPTIGVLGLAFKPGTDDLREAPALAVAARLLEAGVRVRAHDPVAVPNAREIAPDIHYCADAYEAVTDCDAVLLATEWPEYLGLDWARARSLMRGAVILDGRNVLDARLLRTLGVTYLSFGRSETVNDCGNGHEPSDDPEAQPLATTQLPPAYPVPQPRGYRSEVSV